MSKSKTKSGKSKLTSTKKQVKKADQYNDPSHNYLKYWSGRDYEHAAEEIWT